MGDRSGAPGGRVGEGGVRPTSPAARSSTRRPCRGAGLERQFTPVASLERLCRPVERPTIDKPPPRRRHQQRQLPVMDRRSAATNAAAAPMTGSPHLPPRPARRSRDAAGTRPTPPDRTRATPAALGHQPAAAPATQPDRPAHTRRPAPALLTPRHRTNRQPCQADRIPAAVTGADRTHGDLRAGHKRCARHETTQQVKRHRAGWC
jgi:hypothetical protein